MYTITNQDLYASLVSEFKKSEITADSAQEAYDAMFETLSQQGFAEDLVEKCASITFDAMNDCYSEAQGIAVQTEYAEGEVEDLFNAGSFQDLYALFESTRRGLRAAFKQRRKNIDRAKIKRGGWAHLTNALDFSGAGKKFSEAYNESEKNKEETRQRKYDRKYHPEESRSKKGFFGRFRDDNGSFMGLGKNGEGMVKWAKKNKAQAATAAAATAAVVGGTGYLAYRAYKKKKAAQQAQHNQPQGQIPQRAK